MDREERYTYHIDEYDEFDWCVIDNTTDEDYVYLEDITKVLNKQNQQIADLEAKLAESERESNARYSAWQEEISECDRLRLVLAEKDAEVQSWKDGTMVIKLGKLEEQLAEKEKEIEIEKEVADWLYDIHNRTGFEQEVSEKFKTATEVTAQFQLYEYCKNQFINDLRSEVKKKLKD